STSAKSPRGFPPGAEAALTLAERGEEDHVADRLATGQHHRQPVDSEPEAACRRHPVRERLDVVRVALLAARDPLLHGEALGLLLGVVDLAERVAELDPADEVLEALGQL